ncbi:MAG: hypothetical protein Q9191_004025 [Dirinaria sp. TL-2023a]
MLKSTYKPAPPPQTLPNGWTEHLAPSGHRYYYNAAKQESTYVRPTDSQQATPAQTPATAYQGLHGDHGRVFGNWPPQGPPVSEQLPASQGEAYRQGRYGNAHNQRRRPEPIDRPKSKHVIPGCSPWLLVNTKLGRRFVFNPDSRESFWKFPAEVMKGVVEYDRLEREKKQKAAQRDVAETQAHQQSTAAEGDAVAIGPISTGSPSHGMISRDSGAEASSDEYEEVEVTDDEDEENASKRQKLEEGSTEQPVEFNEDDIAYQLAAMGQDYGLDPGEYGEGGDDVEEGAEGLPLTEEDSHALFKDMLDDHNINPYTTWDKIIEAGHLLEDDRYTVLPNMKSRRELWANWSREKIQQLKEQRENQEKKDPLIPYMAFLQKYATPKLFWPEFKRKYKKEPEMRNARVSDKDREKWYREYINRLKLPEKTLKSDLKALLKFLPLHALNRSSTLEALPPAMLTDLRYIALKPAVRDPIIESHILDLPPAPAGLEGSEGPEEMTKQRQERERREKALAERQLRVEEEKRRQRGALQFSKGMLREGEQELERAKKVGKEGLLGYMQEERPAG